MARYTIICSNEECTYKLNFTMNYIPTTEGKTCELCQSPLQAVDVATTSSNTSAALVSGVGCITSKIPGDFKDLLKSIKKGSPGCNMDKY